jgi:hypothetical protein
VRWKNGSAGGARTRTFFTLEAVIGIPFSRWGAQPFVAHPFAYPTTRVDTLTAEDTHTAMPTVLVQHPIRLAMEWHHMLEAEPNLNMAKLAETRGISRARVTQVMNLLRLPEQVRETLLAFDEPAQIRALSERKLRSIVACPDPETQNRQVQELVAAIGR